MIRVQWFQKKRLVCLLLGLGLGWGAPAVSLFAAEDPATGSVELLEAEPVETLTAPEPKTPSESVQPEPAPAPEEFGVERLLQPYYFSAYIPRPEQTEVNLGLFLSQNPGIDVSVAWGAMQDLMFSAKIAAFGASSTVGLGLKYLLLPEWQDSSKPALALAVQTLFLNHRTLGEPRENIYRGSRFQTGVIVSKDLGALAAALQAQDSVRSFLSYFRLHAQATVEYQSGRVAIEETAEGQAAAGAKAALEAMVSPGELYVTLVFDTLPDWMDAQNYYLGVRYFSAPDLAFDVIAGRLQNGYGADASISWIF
jgi:hypothetical protein